MRGKDLKFLAGVADLARLDLEAASLTLIGRGTKLTAVYGGMYSHGWRTLTVEPVGNFRVPVSASQFKTMTGFLPDDADIELRRSEKSLLLRGPATRIDMREWGEAHDPEKVGKEDIEWSVKVSQPGLLAEADIAAGFVAEAMMVPALTGIHLEALDGGKDKPMELDITAYNGFGALYQTTLKSLTLGSGGPGGEMIVPTLDFLLGLRLIGGGDVYLTKTKGRDNVALHNRDALFRSSIIAGEWPETGRITNLKAKNKVSLRGAAIRALTGSVKALGAAGDVIATSRRGRITFAVEGESGRFTTSIEGNLPGGGLRFDAATLALATRLGEELTMAMPDEPDQPSMVSVNGRRCWLVTRV